MAIELNSEALNVLSATLPRVQRVDELVGNTPMLRLSTLSEESNPVFVKLENMNPSGSVRDRYVAEIIERAMMAGQVMAGDTIVLAGINDSAVAAACIGAVLGLQTRIYAPKDSSRRLVPYIERFGGEIIWSESAKSLAECVQMAAKWARESPERMYVDGYRRQAVTESYQGIGAEILASLAGVPLGGFVTSVTTGATFREVSRVLRAANPELEVRGARLIENEFATAEENPFIMQVTLSEIWESRDRVAAQEGLLLGPKGAACVCTAVKLAKTLPAGRAVVALNPDAGQRYLGWEEKSLFRT